MDAIAGSGTVSHNGQNRQERALKTGEESTRAEIEKGLGEERKGRGKEGGRKEEKEKEKEREREPEKDKARER